MIRRPTAGILLAAAVGTVGCGADGTAGDPWSAGGVAAAVVESASEGAVHVEGVGCGRRQLGSGFVVGPGLVATAAHVVAGVDDPTVTAPEGPPVPAYVVGFEPGLDLALLAVLDPLPDPLPGRDAAPPEPAAAVRSDARGRPSARRVAVTGAFVARTADIHGAGQHRRATLLLDGDLRRGDSGAPVVAADGAVVGMVFAVSTETKERAYALAWSELSAVVARRGTARVDTGPCVIRSVPGRGDGGPGGARGRPSPARPWSKGRWAPSSADLDEDALAGALFGGLDDRLLLACRHVGETLGAAGVGEHLAALLHVGEPVVEEGEHVRCDLFTETVARAEILIDPDLHRCVPSHNARSRRRTLAERRFGVWIGV
jgi:hypothetical protein